ncbi:MAG: alanine--glyoxylate aminotransferase family protein [Xanthomonadales bacterium]|nr:aminotransferase class V-fold PLP-dependent enzyme [Gammaproteobacteria bacterium]MBT8050890.1 aminotransferase class V-fold PLP-dependent enzyme [Gammaproteobacteria bacterium]MBT8057446.1 aminotransferase class V-fold PLP-dependent enzyme [Gammaproteobacteria bacterium]NNJ78819.1 alanine--glyoxylate aminotransferase family protein [Xanthomonadales bacterium]NNL05714.1 alanine--glyoxylate aminotransferase family protein [Xanthomonadales bacterium]
MPGLLPDVDPDGLLEYSVVFTDRSLNHMSQAFQQVVRDISSTLNAVYGANATVVVPGGGTYGMEAIARQFATQQKCLVIRNGYFSFRWSQILETGELTDEVTVIKARRQGDGPRAPFAPPPIEEVVSAVRSKQPGVVFAPHVDTASGVLIPDDYIRSVANAVHQHGGLFVLDCVASGGAWVNMKDCGVDVLLSAPQKGWSASPCAALVMLSEAAVSRMADTTSSSFACDLGKWHEIMRAYLDGGHAYHATLPTDALRQFRDTMLETGEFGFDRFCEAQWVLGRRVREMLEDRGFESVAAEGFKAPGVVVSYTDDPAIQNGSTFFSLGLQIAAGVPLMCDEGDDYRSFRVGLFGLDKLRDIDGTVQRLASAVDSLP